MREFNLDRMMSYPRCAVLIQSEDDALEFLEYLRLRKKNGDKIPNPISSTYWYRHRNETCYTFFGADFTRPEIMSYGSKTHFERIIGYEIITLDDLCVDNTEICESDCDITILFNECIK